MNKISLLTILVLLALSCTSPSKEKSAEEVPVAIFHDLEGNEVKLEDYTGKVVFLNFWATWCRPCVGEMPDIEKARLLLAQENVVFLAASDEPKEKILKFKDSNPYQFQYLQLQADYTQWGVSSLPTTIIYKPDGSVGSKTIGALDWASEEMIANIKSFL